MAANAWLDAYQKAFSQAQAQKHQDVLEQARLEIERQRMAQEGKSSDALAQYRQKDLELRTQEHQDLLNRQQMADKLQALGILAPHGVSATPGLTNTPYSGGADNLLNMTTGMQSQPPGSIDVRNIPALSELSGGFVTPRTSEDIQQENIQGDLAKRQAEYQQQKDWAQQVVKEHPEVLKDHPDFMSALGGIQLGMPGSFFTNRADSFKEEFQRGMWNDYDDPEKFKSKMDFYNHVFRNPVSPFTANKVAAQARIENIASEIRRKVATDNPKETDPAKLQQLALLEASKNPSLGSDLNLVIAALHKSLPQQPKAPPKVSRVGEELKAGQRAVWEQEQAERKQKGLPPLPLPPELQ